MEYKDYYKILGVARTATQDEVKRAYRKLARKYHPDVSKEADAEARFKEMGEAYKVLKDPESRASYDRLGANWHNGQDFQPPPETGGFHFNQGGGASAEGMDFGDCFEQMFGQQTGWGRSGGARNAHMLGQDHLAKVQIDLE